MRYPQFFATLEIEKYIEGGKKRGIIWHTQGSGKTALAYFNVPYLTHYFRAKKIVPKFYFVVDRLDLLTQAHDEFTNRGLQVNIVNSRDEFKTALKAQGAKAKSDGKNEITVVNIQKFSDESKVVEKGDYDLTVQRVYFLDEVHRSYNPRGSFLANLIASDPNAIFMRDILPATRQRMICSFCSSSSSDILSVIKGTVFGVWKPTKWIAEYDKRTDSHRKAFDGIKAEDEIFNKFFGRYIVDLLEKGSQNPVRYFTIKQIEQCKQLGKKQ